MHFNIGNVHLAFVFNTAAKEITIMRLTKRKGGDKDMIVYFLWIVYVGIELGLAIWSIKKKSSMLKEKVYTRLGALLAWLMLTITPVIDFDGRWYGLLLFLVFAALIAVIKYFRSRDKDKIVKIGSTIFKSICMCLVISLGIMPAVLLPQSYEVKPDGQYGVKTKVFTWTDESRDETFTEETDYRKITVEFWYPTENVKSTVSAEGKFPLVVFSHGANGVRESNLSTYYKLASHGYVVCSIDHTYHSFFTEQEDGKKILIDPEYLNETLTVSQKEDSPEKFDMTQGWQKLRVGDMTFCLAQIRNFVNEDSNDKDEVFDRIDINQIGLMGHSLGGSTAAGVARIDQEIDAVVVMDGTMLGEETGVDENGIITVTDETFPVPILNFDNGSAYREIESLKQPYPNRVAMTSQDKSYEIAILNAGHMNFCDLAMLCPLLAKNVGGTGTVNSKECMEFVNENILQFFDIYLKDEPGMLPKEQILEV